MKLLVLCLVLLAVKSCQLSAVSAFVVPPVRLSHTTKHRGGLTSQPHEYEHRPWLLTEPTSRPHARPDKTETESAPQPAGWDTAAKVVAKGTLKAVQGIAAKTFPQLFVIWLILYSLERQDGIQPDWLERFAETNVELQNANIEKYTNFTLDKLTPKGSGVFWSVAGVAFALAQIALLPPETLNILVPLECGAVLVDSLFFRSVLSKSVARVVFPPYQERIVKHEAGHFLIGYLLGAPIQRCIVTVPQLFKEKALVAGQGGTIFFVPEIKEKVMRGQLRRETIDRLSIITMAGIAAEALQFGNAEGGRSDEAALRLFLGRDIFPPWSLPRVTLQARWAVTQAVLLLKEYSQAYDNLVEALRQGKPVGDCVDAIERGLPDGARDAIRRRQDMRQMTAPSLPVGVGGASTRSGSFICELLKMTKQNGDGGEG
ncbi:unnamed protein product [Vitrella brassicaformis CCMP3155]|uniref:Peptidase M41 domain-containing protein n=1 Tax=Vitrella brassicaformis (strain CCMP3155) TaxID=1169540 RepID=A0A0G4FCY5_VITBC|nr:unnamed protein product [Vitrella brassicaformis CCMP3155]|eukprot:CEM11091.1 unnamed protein product [Vitrella brassicaformis CCMP3155]